MGSSPSKSSNAGQSDPQPATKADVLLAPVFAIPISSSQARLPPSVYDRAHQAPFSALDYLHQTDPSVRLLQDFMLPGVWIDAAAAAGTQVRASVFPTLSATRLAIQRRVVEGASSSRQDDYNNSSSSLVQLLAGTDCLPAIRARLGSDALSLSAQADVQGRGWVGAALSRTLSFATTNPEETDQEYYRNDPFQNDDKDVSNKMENGLRAGDLYSAWMEAPHNLQPKMASPHLYSRVLGRTL